VTPIRLYPLHCTLYCCTLTPTLTHRQSSALVALSPAFVSDFCFNFRSVHSIGYNFHSTFHLRFRLEVKSFFPKFSFLLEVSRELPQRSTLNTFFRCSQFSRCPFVQLTLFALAFFVCATFSSVHPILPYSGFHFLFFVGRVPNKPLDFANLF
jgi:hypothetical protein